MKAAICIVLTGLLATLPLKQVLAQAEQQQSQATTTQETSTSKQETSTSSPATVGVPALKRGSSAALLWATRAVTAPAADSLAYDTPPPRRVSTVGWVAIGVVGAIALLFAFALIACANDACR